jgi:hypothetical protein
MHILLQIVTSYTIKISITMNITYWLYDSIIYNRIMQLSVEDFVYGATDGSVTTFAVVAGVVGAELSPSIVLIC